MRRGRACSIGRHSLRPTLVGFAIALASMLAGCGGGTSPPPSKPPQWVLRQFFGPDGFPAERQYVTGEMRGHADDPTLGEGLPADVRARYRLLRRSTPSGAAWAVALDGEGRHQDWYAFLRHEHGVWKLAAVRTLSIPAAFEGIDDPSLALARQSDAGLRRYVRAHLGALDGLADQAGRVPFLDAVPGNEAGPASTIAEMRGLKLSVLEGSQDGRLVTATIGGASDATVGFFRADSAADLPPVTASHYFYIERAAPHWFVFKTT